MKTFLEFLTEEPRREYHDWGIIHPSGKIISGLGDPDVNTHMSLKTKFRLGLSDAERAEHPPSHYAEYLDEKGEGMKFRTRNNKHSIGAALHGLKTLPSSTGQYSHDGGAYVGTSGSEAAVRGHLKRLHAKVGDKAAASASA